MHFFAPTLFAGLALAAPRLGHHHHRPHPHPIKPTGSGIPLPSGNGSSPLFPTASGSGVVGPTGTGVVGPTGISTSSVSSSSSSMSLSSSSTSVVASPATNSAAASTSSSSTSIVASTTTSSAAANTSTSITVTNSTSSTPKFFGINESGPEFGETNIPGTYGTDYTWLNLSTIDTFIAAGMNTFRINILMERLVPDTMTGSLDSAYAGNLTEAVDYITQAGAYAMITPHNYGRYNGQVMSSTDDFKTFWTTVATPFASYEKVIFDTNNEYHDMSSTVVAQLNQAAIDGIRAAGATSQYITVEGNAYTGAWTWTTTAGTDGLTNADTMGNLTDPQNKIIYQMHQYLDSDGSGTSETCVSATIGSERLEAATTWLRENNKIGLIGEYAGAVNDVCESAIGDMLDYMQKNDDVWSGALWWAAGPWWADYMFSVEPTDGPAYATYEPMMKQHAAAMLA